MHLIFIIYFFFFLTSSSFPKITADSGHCANIKTTFQNCITLPTQQASLAWTFHLHNSTLNLLFTGAFISPSGWVAWGINPTSPQMTGTRALIAFPDPNSGRILLLPYILDPNVKLQNSPLLSRPLDTVRLLNSSAAMYGGSKVATIHKGAQIQIYATLKLEPNKTKIHHVWNRGLYVQGHSPTVHPTTANDLSSTATIDVMLGTSSPSQSSSHNNIQKLKVAHGIINAISWGILLPIGVVIARYFRHIHTLGPAWFYAHAATQLVAYSLGTIGFGIGIRLGQMSPGVIYGLHRKIGIAAVCLGGMQTLALLFRPKSSNKFRKYWKSYHHLVGYGCVVLGVVNVFQGFEAMGTSSSYSKLAYCLGLSTLIGLCIALEVNSWVIFCRTSKEETLRREGLIGGSSQKDSDQITHSS